jgi:hypothetical protein
MATGKNYKLYVSSTGAAGGTMTEVELQGDLTINPGLTNERTAYKNGAVTAQGNDGFSASCVIAPTEPMSVGQQLVYTHWDTNKGASYIEIKSTTTGSIKWAGPVLLSITQITANVKGVVEWTLDISENGTVVRSIV